MTLGACLGRGGPSILLSELDKGLPCLPCCGPKCLGSSFIQATKVAMEDADTLGVLQK